MEGFSLLFGHMLGDYIMQNDWQAQNKTKSTPVCLIHCCCYTIAIWATSAWFLPWYFILLTGVLHFPVDRWRLARKFMAWNGQEDFATGVFSPWSIIVVDNTIHLFVLFALGRIATMS